MGRKGPSVVFAFFERITTMTSKLYHHKAGMKRQFQETVWLNGQIIPFSIYNFDNSTNTSLPNILFCALFSKNKSVYILCVYKMVTIFLAGGK